MKIKRFGIIIAVISFALYMTGGAIFSVLAIRNSLSEANREMNATVSTLVADMVSEPLRLGSFVEARNRIQSFIKRGMFECADLFYEGMPISKCASTDGLRPFPTELQLGSQPDVQNPILVTYVDEGALRQVAFQKGLSAVGFILAFGLIFLIGIIYFLKLMGREIEALSGELAGDIAPKLDSSPIFEINLLRKKLSEYVSLKNLEIESQMWLKISKQVAHDIRSPLSALQMATVGSEMTDEKRNIIKLTSDRIRGIADDLLKKSRMAENLQSTMEVESASEIIKKDEVNLSAVILEIIQEKNATSRDCEIHAVIPESVKVRANDMDLGRVVSNLVNNSIESFVPGRDPKLEVTVREYQNRVTVFIKDNGRGIPASIQSQVGESGFTFGKAEGNGLGVSFAKAKLSEWGGSLQIFSKENEGTMVTLNFVKA